jgi:hypothetical protein
MRVAYAWSEGAFFYSPDGGTSWQRALAPADSKIEDVQVSPALARDGLVFITGGGALWRSADAGATWTRLEPVAGQFVHSLRFSPNFAADAMLFVGLAAGPFPFGDRGTGHMEPAGDSDSSAGVLISRDRGDTWTPANDGLRVDDDAYQAIQEIEVSPTFERDGTVFALGWGPFESVQYFSPNVPAQRAALFRSQDRGASWEAVQTFGPKVSHFLPQLALSPTFAEDHIVLEAIEYTGPSPSSYSCPVSWSDDGGVTWTEKLTGRGYEGCQHLQVFGAGDGFESTVQKVGIRYWSPDSGRTWGYTSVHGVFGLIAASPNYRQDRTLFAAGDGGIWSTGPDVMPTEGMLPCPASPKFGFGRVWGENADVRAVLGCAVEEERPVTIRQREHVNVDPYCGPARVLWLDDTKITVYYELCARGLLNQWEKSASPSHLPDAPEQVVRGMEQLFEGGILLFVPQPDGRRSILLLPTLGQWREYPD